jgi:hypothetical protein
MMVLEDMWLFDVAEEAALEPLDEIAVELDGVTMVERAVKVLDIVVMLHPKFTQASFQGAVVFENEPQAKAVIALTFECS